MPMQLIIFYENYLWEGNRSIFSTFKIKNNSQTHTLETPKMITNEIQDAF